MPEILLSDSAANALAGTVDAVTGTKFPAANQDPWLAAYVRQLYHLATGIAAAANNLRVYADDSAGTTIGVRAGRCTIDGTSLAYAGGLVTGLTNNAVTYVWAYNLAGTLTINSAVSGTGWPGVSHVKLAEVTIASGAVTAILDHRPEYSLSNAAAAAIAALTGTTNQSFTVDSDATGAKFKLDANGATGAFTLSLVIPNLAGNVTVTLPALGGTLATLAGAETLTNKTIAGTLGALFTVLSGGATAKLALDTNSATGNFTLSVSPANLTANRRITLPDATDTAVLLALAQTLTNKTLTSPVITQPGSNFPTYMPQAAPQSISGPGAINITSYCTRVTTTGSDAFTLANGAVIGQLKKIQFIVDGGDGTLTPTSLSGGTTITFADVGDYALLCWNGTAWAAIELGNDVDGSTAPVLA